MSTRSARSSIVFAGSFNDELISSINQPVRCVPTLFDVIGELTTCSASDLVDAVVIAPPTNFTGAVDFIRLITIPPMDGSKKHVR